MTTLITLRLAVLKALLLVSGKNNIAYCGVLNSVLITPECCVATDGKALLKINHEDNSFYHATGEIVRNFLIPSITIDEFIRSTNGRGAGNGAQIYVETDGHSYMLGGLFEFESDQTDVDRYPDYTQVLKSPDSACEYAPGEYTYDWRYLERMQRAACLLTGKRGMAEVCLYPCNSLPSAITFPGYPLAAGSIAAIQVKSGR